MSWKWLGALQGGGDSGGYGDLTRRTGTCPFPEGFLSDPGHPLHLDIGG